MAHGGDEKMPDQVQCVEQPNRAEDADHAGAVLRILSAEQIAEMKAQPNEDGGFYAVSWNGENFYLATDHYEPWGVRNMLFEGSPLGGTFSCFVDDDGRVTKGDGAEVEIARDTFFEYTPRRRGAVDRDAHPEDFESVRMLDWW